MPTYIALLRGINVGNNMLKMERLCEVWKELGFADTKTYIQSGNVLFKAKGTSAGMSSRIEKRLAGEVRLPVTAIIRTPEEMRKILLGNPFLKEVGIDLKKLYVAFLGEQAPGDGEERLAAIDAGADRFRIRGKDVYLYCPGGYGGTKLSNMAIEKRLGIKATTRNWNTVNKLVELAKE
jgi:uncharacterized protein (DUF1697 family)